MTPPSVAPVTVQTAPPETLERWLEQAQRAPMHTPDQVVSVLTFVEQVNTRLAMLRFQEAMG